MYVLINMKTSIHKTIKIRTDKSLDKLDADVLFKEKNEQARKTLEKYKVPHNIKRSKRLRGKAA